MIVKSNNLADLVKKRRIDMRMSQRELSEKLGWGKCNGQAVSNAERKLCQFPVSYINKLSIILMLDRKEIVNALLLDYKDAVMKELGSDIALPPCSTTPPKNYGMTPPKYYLGHL